jgi:hypothetical protein
MPLYFNIIGWRLNGLLPKHHSVPRGPSVLSSLGAPLRFNEKDELEGKPVARQLAPMISQFIRAQWESEELEGVDDERRQILEEAAELDHIWGV